MILGCVSVSARSVAQNQRVSLNLRNCTVMQLFEEIQQQTRLFFFYDQKHFQGQNVLTVRADDEEVGGLLKRLFADKNVEFVFALYFFSNAQYCRFFRHFPVSVFPGYLLKSSRIFSCFSLQYW